MFWKIIRPLKPVFRPLLERYFRSIDRIKLAMLKLQGLSTVAKVINGELTLGPKVLIYATYPTNRVLPLHIELLEKFSNNGYSIIIASNSKKLERVFSSYLSKPWIYLIRRPFGRDFGCYRDAAMHVYSAIDRGEVELDRLIFLNDSIVITRSSIGQVFDFFEKSENDFLGLTENYNFAHHVGSFAMCVTGTALQHPLVRRYWQGFTPLSTRKYCIEKGEFGFSRIMKRAGYFPSVLWTLAHMKRMLEQAKIEDLWDICASMEKGYRDRAPSAIGLTDSKLMRFSYLTSEPRKQNAKPGRKEKHQRKYMPDGERWSNADDALEARGEPVWLFELREKVLGISDEKQRQIALRETKSELVNGLVAYAFRGSQVHHAAPLLFYTGAGIVKKDLIYRRIIDPFDMARLLINSRICDEDEAVAIEKEILEKGHPYSLRGKMRLLYEWDFI